MKMFYAKFISFIVNETHSTEVDYLWDVPDSACELALISSTSPYPPHSTRFCTCVNITKCKKLYPKVTF
ncbi:hypothetical protein Mapa_012584 [Marchantia paleacea]|nr:hypothetical protein Mapa_012584 [Marchantia paleacea]